MTYRALFQFIALATLAGVHGDASAQANSSAPPAISNVAPPFGGTLFFSREQRDRMDRARKNGEPQAEDGTIAPERASVMNGFVRRSDGAATVWVDGAMRSDVPSAQIRKIVPTDVGAGDPAKLKILSELDAPATTVQKRRPAPKRPIAKPKT